MTISTNSRLWRAWTLFLTMLSSLCFVVMDLAAQYLQAIDPIDAVSLMFLRMLPSLIVCYAWLYINRGQDKTHLPFGPRGARSIITLRSWTSFLSLLGFFYATKHLSMSNAITIFQMRPFVLVYLASKFLGESMNNQQYLSPGLAVAGEILIAKPTVFFAPPPPSSIIKSGPESIAHSSSADRYMSSLIILSCMILTTMDSIVMRKYSNTISPALLLGMFSLASVFGAGSLLIVTRQPLVLPSSLTAWGYLLLVQIFGVLTQTFRSYVYKYETAITISLLSQTNIMPAALGEYLLFGSHFDALSTVGAAMTTSAGIWGIARSASGTALPEKALASPHEPDSEGRPLLREANANPISPTASFGTFQPTDAKLSSSQVRGQV